MARSQGNNLSKPLCRREVPTMSFFSQLIKRLEATTFLGEVVADYGTVTEEKAGGAFQRLPPSLIWPPASSTTTYQRAAPHA